jgi:hypothetical protein
VSAKDLLHEFLLCCNICVKESFDKNEPTMFKNGWSILNPHFKIRIYDQRRKLNSLYLHWPVAEPGVTPNGVSSQEMALSSTMALYCLLILWKTGLKLQLTDL